MLLASTLGVASTLGGPVRCWYFMVCALLVDFGFEVSLCGGCGVERVVVDAGDLKLLCTHGGGGKQVKWSALHALCMHSTLVHPRFRAANGVRM